MDQYQNRSHAGNVLADQLSEYAGKQNVIVLALPRGGVPVAYEIAIKLQAPLDVFIVRKLGVPGHAELAMGALAMGNVTVFNQGIIQGLHISKDQIAAVIVQEQAELARRIQAYRGNQPYPDLKNKTVVLVDDGIATGATMRAAIQALQTLEPAKVILAVPVAEPTVLEELAQLVDDVICPLRPTSLEAVGVWYEIFDQTSDDEVTALLKK